MRSSSHSDAVARRLALLSAELAAVREADGLTGRAGEPPDGGPPAGSADSHGSVGAPVPPVPPVLPEPPPPPTPPALDEHTRLRVPVAPVEPPPSLPVPGRHASRRERQAFPEPDGRPTAAITSRLAPSLTGRLPMGPGAVAVVALLVAGGLAWLCWSLLSAQPEPVPDGSAASPGFLPASAGAVVGPPSSGPDGSGAGEGPVRAESGSAPVDLVVHVAGRVRRPGIVVLDPGSRVTDAIEAAGGARPGARLATLNLARPLVDGEQVLVGVPPAPGVAAAAPAPGAPGVATAGSLVNLNTAGAVELESLPEVGPVTAQAILGWRAEHGAFTSVDELLEVDGIGEKTLESIAPFVTL